MSELVTDEMVQTAGDIFWEADDGRPSASIRDMLNAVAPLIAAKAVAQCQEEMDLLSRDHAEAFGAWHKELAKVARVEVLADWFEQQPNWREWGVHAQIRAALAEPEATGRLHGPGCADCDNRATEFHRSRTDKPNRLRPAGRDS